MFPKLESKEANFKIFGVDVDNVDDNESLIYQPDHVNNMSEFYENQIDSGDGTKREVFYTIHSNDSLSDFINVSDFNEYNP